VVALDAASRRVVVGPRTSGSHIVRLREVNWLVDPPEALRCEVKLRARDSMHGAEVTADGLVTLDEPALAAPGQACVFYAGDRVMGGGFIASA
jgi:tRNA-specific 2-thiouridylase